VAEVTLATEVIRIEPAQALVVATILAREGISQLEVTTLEDVALRVLEFDESRAIEEALHVVGEIPAVLGLHRKRPGDVQKLGAKQESFKVTRAPVSISRLLLALGIVWAPAGEPAGSSSRNSGRARICTTFKLPLAVVELTLLVPARQPPD